MCPATQWCAMNRIVKKHGSSSTLGPADVLGFTSLLTLDGAAREKYLCLVLECITPVLGKSLFVVGDVNAKWSTALLLAVYVHTLNCTG